MRIDYSPFFRSTVGFDRLIGLLESASEQGYPPYNIERSDENNYRVTLAVAGFAEKDLSVDVKDRVLTIAGKREGEPNDKAATALLHQGIAGRAFERSFQLAEHVEVRLRGLKTGCCMWIWSASCRKRRGPAAFRSMRRSSRPSKAPRPQPRRRHETETGHPCFGVPRFFVSVATQPCFGLPWRSGRNILTAKIPPSMS